MFDSVKRYMYTCTIYPWSQFEQERLTQLIMEQQYQSLKNQNHIYKWFYCWHVCAMCKKCKQWQTKVLIKLFIGVMSPCLNPISQLNQHLFKNPDAIEQTNLETTDKYCAGEWKPSYHLQ